MAGLGLGVAGGGLPQLFRSAELCLLAGRPGRYVAGQRWHNYGSAGSGGDGWPVSVSSPPENQPVFVGAGEVTDPAAFAGEGIAPVFRGLRGPGFLFPGVVNPIDDKVSGPTDRRMFEISGEAVSGGDAVPFTCTVAFTPLHVKPASIRFVWKYRCGSLPQSPPGLVIENVAQIPEEDLGEYFPMAVYNGRVNAKVSGMQSEECCWSPGVCDCPACDGTFNDYEPGPPPDENGNLGIFVGGVAPDFVQVSRQVVSFRYDPVTVYDSGLSPSWFVQARTSGWRNGESLFSGVPDPEDAPGPWLDANNLYIGSGQMVHAVLWHGRALSNCEIEALHERLWAR